MSATEVMRLPYVGMAVQFVAKAEKEGKSIPFICAGIVTGVYRRAEFVLTAQVATPPTPQLVRSEDGQGEVMEVDCLVFLEKGMMVAKLAPYSSLLTVGAWRHPRSQLTSGN